MNNEENDISTEDQTLDEIGKMVSGYKEKFIEQKEEKKRGRGRKKIEEIKEENIINGSLLILLIDLILPRLVVLVHNRISKEKQVKSSQLQMTNKQRKDLMPIADEAAKQLLIKANPITVLLIALIGIYGINLLMLRSDG